MEMNEILIMMASKITSPTHLAIQVDVLVRVMMEESKVLNTLVLHKYLFVIIFYNF